jgi:serine/threonine protein kinase
MAKRRQSKILLDRGSELLEERIRFCDGRCRSNPIRNFSVDQICRAIQDFQKIHPLQSCIEFEWKKGVLDGRLVFIKRYARGGQEVYRDIVVSSQMSSHNNVLKLLGCCLEIPEGPALVYEYPENRSLDRHIHYGSLPWGTRLKIAKEIANAVAYLHTAFPRPIIHRDIKPANIFLNQN